MLFTTPSALRRLVDRTILIRLVVPLCVIVLMSLLASYCAIRLIDGLGRDQLLAQQANQLAARCGRLAAWTQLSPSPADRQQLRTESEQLQGEIRTFGRQLASRGAAGITLPPMLATAGLDAASLTRMATDLRAQSAALGVAVVYKRQLLRIVLIMAFLLTLAAVVTLLYALRLDVVHPVEQLHQAVHHLRRGEWTMLEMTSHPPGEIGRLAAGVDAMATALAARQLEQDGQMAELRLQAGRAAGELRFLHFISRALSEQVLGRAVFLRVLDELERLLGGQAVLVRVNDDGEQITWSSRAEGEGDAVAGSLHAEPLLYQGRRYGWIHLALPAGRELSETEQLLVAAAARLLALGIGAEFRVQEGRRVALLEERAAIARELHDSIAQSLSYLKIQVTRLQAFIEHGAGTSAMQPVVQELREGLSSAYLHLRELLTAFRIQPSEQRLDAALQDACEEFRNRTSLSIALDYRLQDCSLSVHEEVQILRIVREALTNAVRHAHARQAVVALYAEPDQQVAVSIEDDGMGMDPERTQAQGHYGLTIMDERARSISGRFDIEARPGGGTRIVVRFRPEAVSV